MRDNRKKRLDKWFKKKEIHSYLMTEIVKNILDVVEEIHVTSRHGVTKPKWRELMRRFKAGEQIYTSFQVQIEPDNDDQDEDEHVELTDDNEDYVQLQNYLSIVGRWMPHSLIDARRSPLLAICAQEDVQMPSLHDFVNNNALLGKAVKQITDLAHADEVAAVRDAQTAKLSAARSIPSHMPLKILIIGQYDGMKDVHDKIKAEFNLKLFDVADLTAEIEKVLNPPPEIEAPDPKKAKGKQAVEEPQQNQEELKELTKVAALIKQHREDNPGVETIPDEYLVDILAIKVKYSYPEAKTDEQVINEIKLGIRQDVFKEPEEEVDPKKAKGKAPTKEELEEPHKYKTVQPSGYIVTGLPKSPELLTYYEQVFNGYTAADEVGDTAYSKARSLSTALFPCSLGEQHEYMLETHHNYLIQRSLYLTTNAVNDMTQDSCVMMIEKNSAHELDHKFKIIDPDYEEYKNLVADFGKDSIKVPC